MFFCITMVNNDMSITNNVNAVSAGETEANAGGRGGETMNVHECIQFGEIQVKYCFKHFWQPANTFFSSFPMSICFSAQCAATSSSREIVGLKMYF